MTLSLKRVELSNIRSHEHLIFEPSEEGLTSIVGSNGAGKSTIVDSIAWALYGTKPQGVSKVAAIYRDGAEMPKDKCFARVDIDVDDKSVRVERRMVNKNGGVECEVFLKDENGEWKNVAGPSVTHAEPYIRRTLHMDEKGFLAAVLVQQKQVDQLISASPRERGLVIEKLTGIASVTSALTEARQDYNSLKKAVSFSTIDENELEALRKQLGTLVDEIATKTNAYNKILSEEKVLKQRGVALKEELEAEQRKKDASEAAQNEIISLTSTLASKEEQLEGALEEKSKKKKKLKSASSETNFAELEANLQELSRSTRSIQNTISNLEREQSDSEARLAAFRELVAKSKVKELSKAISGRDNALAKVEKAQEEIQEKRREIVALESSIRSIESAVQVISGDHSACPTCLQKVEDVDAAVASLQKEKASLESKIKASDDSITTLEDVVATQREAEAKFQQLVEALEGITLLEATLEDITSRIGPAKAELKTSEAELKSLERIYREAKVHEETRKDYNALLEKTQTLSNQIEEIKRRLAKLKSSIPEFSQAKLNKVASELEGARSKYLALSNKAIEMRAEIKILREREAHLTEKIEAHEEAVHKHKELLKSVEVAANSTSVLEEFRANRIEHSVPLIEGYASDLLSRFTDGKFTRLKLNHKFEASVMLADGTERAIGLLSGGELSAASMALRLAISMLLNGGSSQNLMILDEVLVSQDAERAELILQTIKDVCRGQVVLIAHNDSINDVVDKLVSLG